MQENDPDIEYNEDNETGIHIPRQKEMEWTFSFFMSKYYTKNMDKIIDGIKQVKFEGFYNIT